MTAENTTDFTPTPHHLVLYRGDSVEIPLRFGTLIDDVFVGYDLTGVEFNAQIRAKEDATEIMASFTIELDDQTDAATRGKVYVRLSAALAATLIAAISKAKWDLQATWPGDVVKTYLKGDVTVGKDTTRV